jgi:acyl-coenzyme A thioesterase PaaI-like protein
MTGDTATPWIVDRPEHERPGGDRYGSLLTATRALLDAVCAADAPVDVTRAAVADLERVTAALAPYGVPRVVAPAGNRPDLPGEGHPMSPPTVIAEWLPTSVRGSVTLTRAHDGSFGMAHGGWMPKIYDDVLGRLASRARPRSRTAFLHVDYRSVTPVGVELTITARIDRIEGRKIWTTGEMHNGDVLLTEAQGLFVVLEAGQP